MLIIQYKKILFLILFLNCFSTSLFSQLILSVKNAELQGHSISSLDSLYPSALNGDSTKAVFQTNQAEFIEQYKQLVQQFGKFQKQNGLNFEPSKRFFHRLYFNESGKLDYYLFKFKDGLITEIEQKLFEKNSELFFKTYQFPIKTKTKFAQCCTVVL